MMTVFGLFFSPVTSMPSKFSITDPMDSSFFEPYSAALKRNFNGAIWSGKILSPVMLHNLFNIHDVACMDKTEPSKFLRCER